MSFDCTNRKNCITLTGLFSCQVVESSFYCMMCQKNEFADLWQDGLCQEIIPPYDCKRVCDDIELGGGADIVTAKNGKSYIQRNLVLFAGENITTGQCRFEMMVLQNMDIQ